MITDKEKITVATLLIVAFLSYTSYLYLQLPAKKHTNIEQQLEGKLVWQKYNCTACHQIYGLGGYLGTDLTNEYSLKGPEFIKAFVSNGTETMPNFHLTDDEINDLLAYLKSIDASGKSDPKSFQIQSNGTIHQ